MRLTSAVVITAGCAAWGTVAGHSNLWLPYSGLAASIVDLLTRSWVTSSRLGEAAVTSAILKFLLMLVGVYAVMSQFVCVAVGLYWLLRG